MQRRFSASVLVLTLAACSTDGSTRPSSAPGLYRLATVNGQPLPFIRSSPRGSLAMNAGDLFLRDDGTFGSGIYGLFVQGTFSTSGQLLYLRDNAGTPANGIIAGDSVAIDANIDTRPDHLVFRRSAMPQSALAGSLFTLNAINGRTDLVSSDEVLNGTRFVGQVLFDSVTFLDAVFFRQHRHQRLVVYQPSGDSLVNSSEFVAFCAYDARPDSMFLRRYEPFTFDVITKFAIESQQLVYRETGRISGSYTETYVRHP